MRPVRSICGLPYIALKLKDSGALAARAVAHPNAALAAPRGRGRPHYAPKERAEVAPRRSAVDTWPGENNSALPHPIFRTHYGLWRECPCARSLRIGSQPVADNETLVHINAENGGKRSRGWRLDGAH